MTAPTIIQTPGAIDTAVSGFMQAYQVARQLSDRRRELDLQAQRVASQTNLEGAQARDLQTKIDAGLADHAAANQANQIFAGLAASGDLSDPSKVQVAIGQVKDAAVQGHFGTLYDNWNKGVQTTAQIQEEQARTKLAAQQTHDLQRQATVTTAVHNVLSRYEGSDLMRNPATQARALADLWTIDPATAAQQADMFNKVNGSYHITALPDGSILTANDRGKWHVTAHAWSGSTAAGGATARLNTQERLVAARQVLGSLQRLQALYRVDHDGVVEPPQATALEDVRGLAGRLVGGGVGQTAAQASRTAHQQLAAMYGNQFIDNYFKFIRGGNTPRSQQFITNFRRAYLPIGPLKEGVGTAAAQSRQELIDQTTAFIRALQPDQALDTSHLPGFSESLNADGALQQTVSPSGGGDFSTDPWNPNK